MSEGRTPTATFTQQRSLEQEDVDLLHQIVIRAQNDPKSEENSKDALLQAYGEIFEERQLNHHQDRVCFDTLLKLLNPATPGDSLYHKFEYILETEGIVLSYDDDATTQNGPGDEDDLHLDGSSEHLHVKSQPRRETSTTGYYPTETDLNHNPATYGAEEYPDNTPPYIAYLLHQAQARDEAVLAKQTLDAWRGAFEGVRESQLEARADALYGIRLKRKVLKQCLAVFEDLHQSQIQADQIYQRNLVFNALGKTTDEYRVRRISCIDEDRVKGLYLYKWTLASREALFTRRKDTRIKHKILQRLTELFRAGRIKQVELEGILQHNSDRIRTALLRAAIGVLEEKASAIKELELRAITQNQDALYQASITSWQLKMEDLAKNKITADDAREYFLMKRHIRNMESATLYRNDRKTWLATWTMTRWREFVKIRKHARYDEAYRQMRRIIKMNLARRFLLHCQRTSHQQVADHQSANALHRTFLLQRIVRPAVEKVYDVAECVKRDETVADQQADLFLQRRAIAAIQMKQQSLFDMSDKAHRLEQYRIEQCAVQNLRQMQLQAFGLQRRQSDADAFRSRHDKRSVRNYLGKLRRLLAERRTGGEGALALVPASAVTPARKKEELLLYGSTRLSTTPAWTPFAVRLTQAPRILEDIDDIDEDDIDNLQEDSVIDGLSI